MPPTKVTRLNTSKRCLWSFIFVYWCIEERLTFWTPCISSLLQVSSVHRFSLPSTKQTVSNGIRSHTLQNLEKKSLRSTVSNLKRWGRHTHKFFINGHVKQIYFLLSTSSVWNNACCLVCMFRLVIIKPRQERSNETLIHCNSPFLKIFKIMNLIVNVYPKSRFPNWSALRSLFDPNVDLFSIKGATSENSTLFILSFISPNFSAVYLSTYSLRTSS